MTNSPKRCWYHLTPDRLLIVLLPILGLLFLSERFHWFAFNEHKGWTVLIAAGIICQAVLLLLLWLGISLVSRLRSQFRFRSLRLMERLAAIAEAMNGLEKSSDAVIHYDMMAGALWWSDERADLPEVEDSWALRPVFRYRMSLILGSPENEFLPYWEEAQKSFPDWPGFAPERCRPNDELVALYHKQDAVAMLSIDLTDILLRLEKEFEAGVPSKIIEKHTYRNEPPDIAIGELSQLLSRGLRLAGRPAPEDMWDRTCRCVADSLGIDSQSIEEGSWLVEDLGAGIGRDSQ